MAIYLRTIAKDVGTPPQTAPTISGSVLMASHGSFNTDTHAITLPTHTTGQIICVASISDVNFDSDPGHTSRAPVGWDQPVRINPTNRATNVFCKIAASGSETLTLLTAGNKNLVTAAWVVDGASAVPTGGSVATNDGSGSADVSLPAATTGTDPLVIRIAGGAADSWTWPPTGVTSLGIQAHTGGSSLHDIHIGQDADASVEAINVTGTNNYGKVGITIVFNP